MLAGKQRFGHPAGTLLNHLGERGVALRNGTRQEFRF